MNFRIVAYGTIGLFAERIRETSKTPVLHSGILVLPFRVARRNERWVRFAHYRAARHDELTTVVLTKTCDHTIDGRLLVEKWSSSWQGRRRGTDLRRPTHLFRQQIATRDEANALFWPSMVR